MFLFYSTFYFWWKEIITFSYCKADSKEIALVFKMFRSQDQIALIEKCIAKYPFSPSFHPHSHFTTVVICVFVELKG